MNPKCTSVRVPYSTWRLQLLRRLCSTADPHVGPTLPFLHPRSLNRPRRDRREFHGSAVRTRSNYKDVRRTERYKAALREREKSPNGLGARSENVPVTLEGAARKAAVPDWNPYTEDSIAEMQDLVGSLRDMAKIAEEKGLKSDIDTPFSGKGILGSPSEKVSDSPLGDRAPRRRDKGERESEVQFDLGSEDNTRASVLAEHPLQKKKSKYPKSPFEDKSSKRQHKKKAHVQEVEVDPRLENNIWAQILATDTRLEKGTKARLPKALMVDWGPIRHPETDQDYFLPIELSDLESLREELERTKKLSEFETAPNEEDDGRKIDHTKPRRPRVRILPDQLLVQVLTDELVSVRSIRGKPKGVYQTTSKKLSALFIPYRWKYKQEEFQSFQRTRQKFNEALGLEPNADEPDVNDMARLDKLQWQHDIAERMEKIMQLRVLIALEAVGRDNASGRVTSSRLVSTLYVPKTGHLHKVDSEKVTDNEISNASEAEQTLQTPPDWMHGAIFLHVGDPKLFRTTVEKWHHHSGVNRSTDTADLENLPSDNLLPPMITINNQYRIPVFNLESLFGADQATAVQQSIKTNEIFTLEYWSRSSEETGTPSEFSHVESNTPSADVTVPNSILDAGGQVLSSILTPSVNTNTNTNTIPPKHPSSNKNKNTHATSPSQSPPHSLNQTPKERPEEYLILIKARAVHAAVLAREIWQLWRYIGGRTGLDLGGDAQENKDTESRSNSNANKS